MYAVGSRILYCVVLAYRQKKRNTIDVLKKKERQLGSKSKHHAEEKNVAHFKSNAIYKVFKIASWLQISS